VLRAELTKGPKVNGKLTYKIRIENASPLVLNGLAFAGPEGSAKAAPTELLGLCVPPKRSWSIPATSSMVDSMHLRQGVRITAADLSGL
ncbi:hypothetical protein ACYOEI_22295, partial [Singulisphaera rosea]